MNTKHLLVATLFTALSGAAFAGEMVAAAPNADLNSSVQLAQASPEAMPGAKRGMTSRNAARVVTNDCFVGYSEAASSTVCPAPSTRTRAEVRAETLQWLASSRSARNTDSIYFGSAQ
jgi:hypothetical protein